MRVRNNQLRIPAFETHVCEANTAFAVLAAFWLQLFGQVWRDFTMTGFQSCDEKIYSLFGSLVDVF